MTPTTAMAEPRPSRQAYLVSSPSSPPLAPAASTSSILFAEVLSPRASQRLPEGRDSPSRSRSPLPGMVPEEGEEEGRTNGNKEGEVEGAAALLASSSHPAALLPASRAGSGRPADLNLALSVCAASPEILRDVDGGAAVLPPQTPVTSAGAPPAAAGACYGGGQEEGGDGGRAPAVIGAGSPIDHNDRCPEQQQQQASKEISSCDDDSSRPPSSADLMEEEDSDDGDDGGGNACGGGDGGLMEDDEECGVCLESCPGLMVSPCKHMLCGESRLAV